MLFRRSRTYYKYLLSYIAVLLMAVLILLVFSQAFFVTSLRENLQQAHRSRLLQTTQQLDRDIEQLYTIDYQLSTVNQNFFSYYLENPSPLRDLRLVNELRSLLASSLMIDELALVPAGDGQVYTSTAVYGKHLFFDSIFSFDGDLYDTGAISALQNRTVLPARRQGSDQRYLAFFNTPSVFSRLQDTVLIFFVREDHFLEHLSPLDNPGQQGAVLDAEGRVVASTLSLAASPTGDRITSGGVEYLVERVPSAVIDWTYVFLLPAAEMLAPLFRAQVTVMVLLLTLLAAGALVIHMAMRLNYRPIQALTESLGRSGSDDLESLKEAIDSLSAQNAHMQAQLMSSPDGQALKDALLFSLLKGGFSSFEAYNREAAALGMTFSKPRYRVLMLRLFNQAETPIPRKTLSDILAGALGDDFTWYFRDLFEQSMYVCLVGLQEGQEDELTARCRAMLDACAQQHALSFSIGASNCYDGIASLSAACFEATQAVREHFIRGQNQFIAYDELSRTLNVQTNYLSILSALPEQTPKQQMQTVRDFVGTLKADRVPALLAKSYCNSVVQVLLTHAAHPVNMSDLFTFTYLRTADDYLAFMLHLLDTEPLPAPETSADIPVSDLLARIYAVIAQSYDSCNFSIQDAAEKLSLSSSYLGQYFKQQTGETLTGYVAQLRVRKACTLLQSTSMPLQMVSESVGYYNQNSFIRRFKQITGVTPGEYRKANQ